MEYGFIKEIDATLEETTNITDNISMICEGNVEDVQSLYETATQFLANAKEALSKGGGVSDQAAEVMAALRVLSSKDLRGAIEQGEADDGKPNSIRDNLNKMDAKGGTPKVYQALINITKTAASKEFNKSLADAKAAPTDDNTRKAFINTIGKMMSILGNVQAQPDKGKEAAGKMTDWFK